MVAEFLVGMVKMQEVVNGDTVLRKQVVALQAVVVEKMVSLVWHNLLQVIILIRKDIIGGAMGIKESGGGGGGWYGGRFTWK